MCYVYGLAYIVSSLLYHTKNYYCLLLGCVLDGIANSILYTTFESWYVTEHNKLQLPESLFSRTFALATTLNGAGGIR